MLMKFYTDDEGRVRPITPKASNRLLQPDLLRRVKAHAVRIPLILIDENLPKSLEYELRRLGFRVARVNAVLGSGASDQQIKRYAEEHNAIILTRDVSFPEPGYNGDRILIRDVKGIQLRFGAKMTFKKAVLIIVIRSMAVKLIFYSMEKFETIGIFCWGCASGNKVQFDINSEKGKRFKPSVIEDIFEKLKDKKVKVIVEEIGNE